MDRRAFIRVLGGGTVLAAATVAVGPQVLAQGMPKEAVADWAGPGEQADPRRWALGYAILAPNPHNRQPWLVDLREEGVITLYCDRERVLPETDPFGRQILIGHGCFLELLAIALAQRGFVADVQLFPQGEVGANLADIGSKPIARIALKPGGKPDPLFAHILKRHTAKSNYDTAKPVPAAQLEALRASVQGLPVQFGGTVDAAALPALRLLCMESAKVEIGTERTIMESMRLLRVGPSEINQHRDGISINTMFVRVMSAVGLFDRNAFPKPGSPGYKTAIERYEGYTTTAMGFAWLATADNTRATQVSAGRAYVRMHLSATAIGVGMHPLSQALQEFAQMKPHYEQVHQLTLNRAAPKSTAEPTLQMLVRLGYPTKALGPTPRRGVAAIMRA
ncbi:MAG: Acg family FMN-binding oxidoreductase [Burkholderiaceae bacterium]